MSAAARSITWVSDRTADWETHLGYGPSARSLFYVVPALLGAGLGVALHFLLGWLLGLPWLPFQGPLSLLDSIPDQIALPVLIGLGMVAGLIFGAFAWADELSIMVDGSRVRLTRGESDQAINRSAVAAVFMDGRLPAASSPTLDRPALGAMRCTAIRC